MKTGLDLLEMSTLGARKIKKNLDDDFISIIFFILLFLHINAQYQQLILILTISTSGVADECESIKLPVLLKIFFILLSLLIS